MAVDIGETLFVNLLGMTQYPGDPFTGNIYRDLIMFLIVPTIFIIMILYIMSGRIIPDKKFRVMLGVGAYLFIIAGGYYSFFALLAGPYFIFLIFILGVLGYLAGHFKRGGAGGRYSEKHAKGMTPISRIKNLKQEIKETEAEIAEARKHGSRDEAVYLRKKLDELRNELYDLEHPWEGRKAA